MAQPATLGETENGHGKIAPSLRPGMAEALALLAAQEAAALVSARADRLTRVKRAGVPILSAVRMHHPAWR